MPADPGNRSAPPSETLKRCRPPSHPAAGFLRRFVLSVLLVFIHLYATPCGVHATETTYRAAIRGELSGSGPGTAADRRGAAPIAATVEAYPHLPHGVMTAAVLALGGVFALLLLRNHFRLARVVEERRRLEAALRESEHRFRVVSEMSVDIVYAYEVGEGGTLHQGWVTGAVRQVTGYSRRMLRDRGGWISLIHPDDLSLVHGQRKALLANQKMTIVYRIRCRDGATRWLRDHARPIWRFAAQRVAGIEGAVEDITARRSAEEAQRKSEERFKLAMAANRDGLWDWDLRRDEIYFSPGCAAILDYPSDAFPPDGRNWTSLIHPEDRARVLAANRACVDGRQATIEVEFRMQVHRGGWRWILGRGMVAARDDDGRPLRLVGTHTDISARRRADRELRASEEKYRRIYENSVVGFFQSTPEGQFLSVNPTFAEMLAYPSPEALVAGISDIAREYFVNPEDWHRFRERLERDGIVEGVEHPVRRRDGSTIWVTNCTWTYVDTAGKISCYEGMIMDISRRKRFEQEAAELQARLHRSQKMESIGILAGGIAHDFNNILAAILGYAELSKEDVDKGSMVAENLGEIITGCIRARDLIKQILVFARQSDEVRQPIEIAPIAKEVLKLIRSTTPVNIEIRQEITTRAPILGNPGQVHQILMNLCTNAVHAMEAHGGVMAVTLDDLHLAEGLDLPQGRLPAGVYLRIIVADTGRGIPAEIMDDIFDPFFTTKSVGEGTGMGLAVVHGIVQTHKGQIACESAPGRGTTVCVYLPVSGESDADQRPAAQAPARGTERILFLDDEAPIALMGGMMLERLGYRVTVCTDSGDALKRFQAKPLAYDLVITDMTMPAMSGDLLAARLLAIRPDLPIILCTGYSKLISEEAARRLGIRALVYKPVTKSDLGRTVREVLSAAVPAPTDGARA